MQPEILGDSFSIALSQIACRRDVGTILEIGSGSGNGSTQALLAGIRKGRQDQKIFCIEADPQNFADLQGVTQGLPGLHAHFGSSVHPGQLSPWVEVEKWYRDNPQNKLSAYGLETIRSWWQPENSRNVSLPSALIEKIKETHALPFFDLVLIDGSEFTGRAEFRMVYGSRWIALDDVRAFKNWQNRELLLRDPAYRLFREDLRLRNGFSIFRLRLPRLKWWL